MKAFIEALSITESLEGKKNSIDTKIRENEKTVSELTDGKKNVKSMTSKGSNE